MADKGTDHPLERLVFFSDAVFAIAITLLVIEIHPPHFEHGASDAEHWIALANLIPNFVGYFISFAVIGLFWIGHHRAFSLARRYDPRILGWNMAMLGVIAFMPFVTAYLSANINERVPSLVYSVTLLLAGLLNLRVNWTATSPPMVDEEIDPETIAYIRRRGLAVVLGAATAIVASVLLPKAGQAALISIPFWRRLLATMRIPGPRLRPQAEAAAPAQ